MWNGFDEVAVGYDVHITRKDFWSDDDGAGIERTEWLAYVEADPSMRAASDATVTNDKGEAFSVHDETLAIWKDWPGRE